MTDIVQRLRADGVVTVAKWDVLREKAADEIIFLRKALHEIAFYDDFMSKGTAEAMMSIARYALCKK